jgi:hypothetical protein
MSRLPIPGADKGSWGTVLNNYLLQSHNSDGTLKSSAVTNATFTDGSVTAQKLQDGAITNTKIAANAAIDESKIANLTTDLDSKAPTVHTHAATDISSGTVATARLGSGTADTSSFLRGDGTWAIPVASGSQGLYDLGRIRYSAGWPSTRPTGYAYFDWIKSSSNDPDPSTSIMIDGDTISEWS